MPASCHAIQSIAVSAVLILLNFVLGLIPVLGWIVGVLIAPLSFILWLVLIKRTGANGSSFRLSVNFVTSKRINNCSTGVSRCP